MNRWGSKQWMRCSAFIHSFIHSFLPFLNPTSSPRSSTRQRELSLRHSVRKSLLIDNIHFDWPATPPPPPRTLLARRFLLFTTTLRSLPHVGYLSTFNQEYRPQILQARWAVLSALLSIPGTFPLLTKMCDAYKDANLPKLLFQILTRTAYETLWRATRACTTA
jgi:hypothetical protein